MFDTPQESALKAENARLRSENEWLKRAVEAPGSRSVKPWGVEQNEVTMDVRPDIRLPRVASVEGTLMDDGRWSVMAHQERIEGGRISVGYYTDGYRRRHIDDMTFVNHILPKMHEQFIKSLADIFVKQMNR